MQVVQADFAQGSQARAQEPPVRVLARQLQLRLRYARFKVEHGWQKQSINEVENLYFHHHRTPAKQGEPRPKPSEATQKNDQESRSGSQGLSSSVSVFSSRQKPNEVLVLRPPNIDERHSNDEDTRAQIDVLEADGAPHTRHAPHTSSVVDTSTSTTTHGNCDFASEPPQDGAGAHETESGNTSPPNYQPNSSATTTSTAEGPKAEEEALEETPRVRDGEAAQTSPPTLIPDAPRTLSSQDASLLLTNQASRRQMMPSQLTRTTATQGRGPVLTYDTFWSTHTAIPHSFGYPYNIHSVRLDSRPSSVPTQSGGAPKRVSQTDKDVPMSESSST